MRKELVYTAALGLLAMVGTARADPLFTLGNNFTITGSNTPVNVNDTIPFTLGNHALGGGALNLNISIVPDPSTSQSEWVVFTYTATNGGFFGNTGAGWNLDETGIPAAIPLNFIGDGTQWFNGSTALSQTGTHGVFSQTLMPNPVPGGTGQSEGTLGFVSPIGGPGPLPLLGSFMTSANLLDPHGIMSAQVTGYAEMLQFAPQTPIPPVGTPEPATIASLGLGVLGLLAVRNRRRPGSSLPA